MNRKNSPIEKIFFIAIAIGFFLSGCDKTIRFEVEKETLDKIFTSTVVPKIPLIKEVDLYVDYSTCVKDAVDNSYFFKSIRSRLTTSLKPTLHSIKGSEIKVVSNDPDIINQELNNLTEVNAANIRQAVEDITNSNRQAILITDGEFWSYSIGERIDFAYMHEPFKRWLNKGHSIYFIIEDYSERHNNKFYDKKRFYIFFTDDDIENNIFQEIQKENNPTNYGVRTFKLTNSDLKLKRETKFYSDLESTLDTTSKYDYIEIGSSWSVIYNFVINTSDDEGNIIENGIPIIEGLSLKSNELENFVIEDIDLKAYNIAAVYFDSALNSVLTREIKEGVLLDKELYQSQGIISIHFTDKIKDYLYVKNESENLLRIDLVVSKATNKPADENMFKWKAMLSAGDNTSISKSIEVTLDNLDVNPAKQNKGIIHTIFIKTPEYK
jgi:hypothetical protein